MFLRYSAVLATGSSMPTWVSFTSNTAWTKWPRPKPNMTSTTHLWICQSKRLKPWWKFKTMSQRRRRQISNHEYQRQHHHRWKTAPNHHVNWRRVLDRLTREEYWRAKIHSSWYLLVSTSEMLKARIRTSTCVVAFVPPRSAIKRCLSESWICCHSRRSRPRSVLC